MCQDSLVNSVGQDAHGYSLYIRSNAALKSLAERGGLQGAVGGRTLVQNCGSLQSLAGLERITSVGKSANGYSLYISGGAALKSVAGLGRPRRGARRQHLCAQVNFSAPLRRTNVLTEAAAMRVIVLGTGTASKNNYKLVRPADNITWNGTRVTSW